MSNFRSYYGGKIMRVLFAGSPAISVPALKALCNTREIELIAVLTNPDSPRGRHGSPEPTDVGKAAQMAAVPILKPEKLDASVRQQISLLKPDLLVSFAYGRIFGPKFLELFPLGGINIHPSLLPKYRGPSPIQAAILNCDSITGVCIQTLAQEMDCGGILASRQFHLTGRETSESLGEAAANMAADMLPLTLGEIAAGTAGVQVQNHSEACYCKLITKEDGIIDWSQSAVKIDAKIRAFTPWPLCRTIHNGRELIILKAEVSQSAQQGGHGMIHADKQNGILVQTGDGVLSVTQLQYQGKKALGYRDFLNGVRGFTQLG
jgi:methionyl-tRNA formyltransferase